MARLLTAELGVPVVDGFEAAVKLAEMLHGLGLGTSKINAFATPVAKPRPGRPIGDTGGPAARQR